MNGYYEVEDLYIDLPEGFDDPQFELYLEDLVESVYESRSNEDSMHRTPIDDCQNALNFIIDNYIEYKDKYNIAEYLNIDKPVQDWILDLEEGLRYYIEINKLIEELSTYNENIVDYINAEEAETSILNTLYKKENFVKKYGEDFSSISSGEELNDLIKRIVIKENNEKVNNLFINGYSKKNKLQEALRNFSSQLIEEDFNEKIKYKRRLYKNTDFASDKIISSFERYKKYENLFKNLQKLDKNNPDFLNLLDSNTIEKFDDDMNAAIKKNQVKLYAKKFLGSYIKLADDMTFELFNVIKDKNINKNLIKKEIRNIALYQDSNTLNTILENLIKKDALSVTKILLDIDENNLKADILYNDDKYLVVNINNFETSKKLGSSQWCISTSEHYYNSYLNRGEDKNHLFIYDFTKKESHQESKIGITIDGDKITDAFDKSNKSVLMHVNNNILFPRHILEESFNQLSYLKNNKNNLDIIDKIENKEIEVRNIDPEKIFSLINVALKSKKHSFVEDFFRDNNKEALKAINVMFNDNNNISFIDEVFKLNNELKLININMNLEKDMDFNLRLAAMEDLSKYILTKKYNYEIPDLNIKLKDKIKIKKP